MKIELNRAKEGWIADLGRFISAGLINTVLTISAYQMLLFVMPAGPAYALTWLAGMAFVVIVYPSHVFRGGNSDLRAHLLMGGIYLSGFFVGLATVTVLDHVAGLAHPAIFIAVAITTTLNFLGMRLVSRGSAI